MPPMLLCTKDIEFWRHARSMISSRSAKVKNDGAYNFANILPAQDEQTLEKSYTSITYQFKCFVTGALGERNHLS